MFQLSPAILLYETFYYILHFLGITRNSNLISWVLFPHLFIISVLFLVVCNSFTFYMKFKILLLKLLFLIPLFFIPIKIDFNNFIIGSLVLFTYYSITDVNEEYSCDINSNDLLVSYIFSTILYLTLKNIYKI